MKKKHLLALYWVVLLISIASSLAQIEHFYELSIQYSSGELFVRSITVKPITTTQKIDTQPGPWSALVYNRDDTIASKSSFDIPLTIIVESINPETGVIDSGFIWELNETKVIIQILYSEQAKRIDIIDPAANIKLSVDVSDFSRIENNEITGATVGERYFSVKDHLPALLIIIVLGLIFGSYLYSKKEKVKGKM